MRLVLTLLFLFPLLTIAQESEAPKDIEVEELEIEGDTKGCLFYGDVDVEPAFPGGSIAMINFIHDNLNYPLVQTDDSYEGGRLLVQFTVMKDSSVAEVEIIRGATVAINEEVIRVVNLMPKWSPGLQFDKPVNVRYRLPITICLR